MGNNRGGVGRRRWLSPLVVVVVVVVVAVTIASDWPAVAKADITAEGAALLRFLSGLAAVPNSINWSNSSSPCTWKGVQCTTAGDGVQALKLPGVGLYGVIQPGTLGTLSKLQVLSLRSNHLSGNLPIDLTNCTQLRKLSLQANQLSGSIPSFNSSSTPALSVIDLSNNHLSNQIPASLGSLSLRILFLQNNTLSGPIPQDLANLQQLDLSNNNLSGSIPVGLRTFSNSTFSGNLFLCGPPLSKPCEIVGSAPAPSPQQQSTGQGSKQGLRKLDIVLIVVADVVFLLLIFVCFLLWRLWRKMKEVQGAGDGKQGNLKSKKKKKKGGIETGVMMMMKDADDDFKEAKGVTEQNKLVVFKHGRAEMGFDLEDLLGASAEVLGKGSFGTAYKAVLEDGPTVVVKRLREVSVGRREFESHMDAVGRLRHPSLVPLLAYYYSKEEKLLVHDYVPLGNLYNALHGPNKAAPLGWDRRLKVALEAGQAILAIHTTSSKAIHGDIKSSNVLLTDAGGCMISDYGLTPLFSLSSIITKMVGYRAPEMINTRRFTQKTDVYSFGVLLLELLTGKAPSRTSAEEGMELTRWVQSIVREEWTAEVFDKELINLGAIEEEMVHLLQISLSCVSINPDLRPSMAQVFELLAAIRPSLVKIDDNGSKNKNTQSSATPSTDEDSSSSPQENPSPPPQPSSAQDPHLATTFVTP